MSTLRSWEKASRPQRADPAEESPLGQRAMRNVILDSMRLRKLHAVLVWGSLCPVLMLAQETGTWRAASSTAKAITGDIAISKEKLSINFAAFPISQIRSLKPAEIGAAFDADTGGSGSGALYRLNVPAEKKFLHKNSLCGAEDTQWMVTYVNGHDLQVAFFSGKATPLLTPERVTNSTDLCGIYTYVR